MSTPPTQMPIDYKGKRYSGVYSVSGTLMIARIPGIGSSTAEVSGDEQSDAAGLLNAILQDAENSGLLRTA